MNCPYVPEWYIDKLAEKNSLEKQTDEEIYFQWRFYYADRMIEIETKTSLSKGIWNIKCKCNNEIKTGQTSVMCCNVCGLPDEKFWSNKEIEDDNMKCLGH